MVVADQSDTVDALSDAVRRHTRARVVLGSAPEDQIEALLGTPPHTTPTPGTPPGRGYARLGSGPVLRLQVPATPDPYDDATSEAHRKAVLDLLPGRQGAPEPAPVTQQATAEPAPMEKAPVEAAPLEADRLETGPRPMEAAPVAAEG